MKTQLSILLLTGFLWRPEPCAAQDFSYGFSVEGLACGSELVGDPGTTVRLDVTVILEARRAGINTWFTSVGGEGANIAFGVERCAEACLGARLGKAVQIAADLVVDPSFIPRAGPLAGSPQGAGVVSAASLYPLPLEEGEFEIFKFFVDVTFPAAGQREEVRLLFKDGLSSPSISPPAVENSVQVAGFPHAPELLDCSFFLKASGGEEFRRGDCNGDGDTTGTTDAIVMLTRAFIGGVDIPCLSACDVNGDGTAADLADALTLLTYNFLGGVEIPAPYPGCGRGSLESDARLGCERAPDDCR